MMDGLSSLPDRPLPRSAEKSGLHSQEVDLEKGFLVDSRQIGPEYARKARGARGEQESGSSEEPCTFA